MPREWTAAGLIFAFIAAPAAGSALEASVENACSSELGMLCRDVQDPAACLGQYYESATRACRDALDNKKKPPEAAKPAAAAATEEAPASPDASQIDARLTRIEGPVYIHTLAQGEGEFIAAAPGMPLAEGDLIRTGQGAKAEFAWDGGSLIEISENSDFTLTSTQRSQTAFHLGLGRIMAKIRSLMDGQSLEVWTPTALAAVRGTELGVFQDENGANASIAVFGEGKVAVSAAQGGQTSPPVLLTPGHECRCSQGKNPEPPKPLATFAAQKKAMEQLAQRTVALAKTWKPRTPEQRQAARSQLSSVPTFKGQSLSGVKPSQLSRSSPGKQQKQERQQQQQQGRQQQQEHQPQQNQNSRQGAPARRR